MTGVTVAQYAPAKAAPGFATTLLAIAWRNLWRNKRRTWLTSGGIAFAVLLVLFGRSMQDGSFDIMIDNATRFLPGHVQIQHPKYFDHPRVRHSMADVHGLLQTITAHPHVTAASPRIMAFALVSVTERSFGAQVIGTRPDLEFATVFQSRIDGRPVSAPGEALIGSVLARNLGASAGDEVVILGTGKDGGVAAAVLTIVGTFESGQVELDRSVLQIHYQDAAEAFGLADEAHVIAVMTDDVEASGEIAATLAGRTGRRALAWFDLMPEIQQMMELKHISSNMVYLLVLLLVTFSVVNSFIMTVFERTREFGMLLGLGMRPGGVIRMLQIEALWMSLLGVALGSGIAVLIIGGLSQTGIYLGSEYGEILEQYQMPDRLYPAFNVWAMAFVALVMVVAIQIAAIIPALKVRKMNIIGALRTE